MFLLDATEATDASSSSSLMIIGAAVVILLVIISMFVMKKSGSVKPGDGLLIVGPTDSGKTTLFYQLLNGSFVQTHTSMEENDQEMTIGKTKLQVVDFPGHPRVRSQLRQFLPIAGGIVIVVDSVSYVDAEEKTRVSDFFFDLLTEERVQDSKVPILVFCNRADLAETAKKPSFIHKSLEKELEELRKSRSAGLDSLGDEEDRPRTIGKEHKAFEFTDLANKVTFVSGSAKTGNVDAVQEFVEVIKGKTE